MARTPIVAGNWKMNTTAATARELLEAIVAGDPDSVEGVEKIVCPPFVYLPLASDVLVGSSVKVGGQDLHWEEKGAFTGEVSGPMLRDYAEYVIIGHSERRAYFGDSDEWVNRKLKAALAHGLVPIVCVGETLDQRNAGQTLDVLKTQIVGALEDVSLGPSAIVAYEPVWAIGTGVAATSADAQEAISFIRGQLAELQGGAIASEVRILYGGSVTPANIAEYVGLPDVDGGLVGGASLVAASYLEMIRNVASIA
ncbi:MAG: triose-phosphate isomerase [Dehalococcoidia bacterium]